MFDIKIIAPLSLCMAIDTSNQHSRYYYTSLFYDVSPSVLGPVFAFQCLEVPESTPPNTALHHFQTKP